MSKCSSRSPISEAGDSGAGMTLAFRPSSSTATLVSCPTAFSVRRLGREAARLEDLENCMSPEESSVPFAPPSAATCCSGVRACNPNSS